MSSTSSPSQAKLERLRKILQEDVKAAQFEKLVAALISDMTGVGIAVAKTGFQHGGDAGPSGRQGRRFRIETKRYADKTSLSDRELLGEVDDALGRDPALECWILAATREAPEQLELSLMRKADQTGVPIIIIDWKSNGFPALAALCTHSPGIVLELAGKEASDICRALLPEAEKALARLAKDLASWGAGYERLRALACERLQQLWTSPSKSTALLGQNAAGGACPSTVRRSSSFTALSQWWSSEASEAPAVVVGLDGMGKTWATLDWLVNRSTQLPLILVISSNAMADFGEVSEGALKRLLAQQLLAMTQSREMEHWLRRIDRLLQQPTAEGPGLVVFFDGINQEPSVNWTLLFAQLQSEPFSGHVRVILSTRKHHFEQNLGKLRKLVVAPLRINVDLYDDAPGGELDQRLLAEGMVRSDLHEDLLPLARTPRLFKLVVQFKERLVDGGQVTVHRLLWEYGRDSFGERAGISFSELEWRQWLQGMAERYLGGIRQYTLSELAGMAARPDLSHQEVARRLSDIVDSQFIESSTVTGMQLSDTLVNHALGMALLHHLDELGKQGEQIVTQDLNTWLDPIAALDQRSEILRAAVSIMVEREDQTSDQVSAALVSEWLSSQNIPTQHASELIRLASALVSPLLSTIERAGEAAQRTARLWAVKALRSTSREDTSIRSAVIQRASAWLKSISRDYEPPRGGEVQNNARAARFIERIGSDIDGCRTVLGIPIELVESKRIQHEALIPLLLEGYPLADALPVFELAAITLAIRARNELWEDFQWMCLLNPVDFSETAQAIKVRADALLDSTPEAGVHPQLAARCSALLLWLSGDENNEVVASARNPALDKRDYEKNYLNDPARSPYRLERRHAIQALETSDLAIRVRIDRTRLFWIDPTFVPPTQFSEEAATYLRALDPLVLDRERGSTPADHFFEQSLPAMARTAPQALIDKLREKHTSLSVRPSASIGTAAASFCREFLLFNTAAAQAAQIHRIARTQSCDAESTCSEDEAVLINHLLIMECAAQDPLQQVISVMEADLPVLYLDLLQTLKPLSSSELDQLIARYAAGSAKQISDLLDIFSMQPCLNEAVWQWLEHQLDVAPPRQRAAILRLCCHSNRARLGQRLNTINWHWGNEESIEAAHWGSLGVIAASLGWPYEQVCERIAPWLLLKSLKMRDASVSDIQLCFGYISAVIDAPLPNLPEPGSEISVRLADRSKWPECFTVSPSREAEGTSLEQLLAWNTEEQVEAQQKAARTAIQRVKEMRNSGARFYLQDFSAADFLPVINQLPAAVDHWLSGAADDTLDFRRRLRLAEGFYLALCEALFQVGLSEATLLWGRLRTHMSTKFTGVAGVSELKHLLFRVPTSEMVEKLLVSLLDLSESNTDSALLEVSICAFVNGRQDWLDAVIEEDLSSGVTWRRQRGMRLIGLSCGNRLPVDIEWPVGILDQPTSRATENTMCRYQNACARHWWDHYWKVDGSADAYLAWNLFCASADRRVYGWLNLQDCGKQLPALERARRMANFQLNEDQLKAAIKKREKDLDGQFLGRATVRHVGPWAFSRV
ncbi:hypothetical protein [Pseudomonas sp. DrBHI1]|uniref:hypothetical protein n=1 Tax=Pseudomonas sp. DrBHI1 TaxID=2006091 RepID=UPI000B592C00|nr:hypothetical protein [Pseudomonas sp. DrBHI1]OWQ35567.1 hypothetical protein CC207_14250 [Pseudomonas sp. DrBHI1]